jgi:serine/threonine-protein kinase
MSEVVAPEDIAEDGLTTDTLTRGTRLGRYELLLPVAMGGMAKVWAARQRGQRGFSKLVAIKTILPNLSEDPAFESMFLDEARIASNVHHPNVCDIYELGEEGKVLYLAMEWVNGDSLIRVLRQSGGVSERIDPRIAARIVADACAGVHAAHELADDIGRPLGVVHRDMSPHNILLSADGNVKVTDFGVAKAIGQLHDQTSTGTLKGKVNYMAPEQVTGTHIDRRSDVFALGCVLYEATTGQLPFRSKNELDHVVMQRLMAGHFAPPSQLLPGYPRELEAIVVRAIANQPIQRFASAERMRMALEEWLQMSGPIVTQSHVSAIVRARVGHSIDNRRERIRIAMSTTGPSEDTGVTPNPSASGVMPMSGASASGGQPARRSQMEMAPLSQPLGMPDAARGLGPQEGSWGTNPNLRGQAPGALGDTAAPASPPVDELAPTAVHPAEVITRAVSMVSGAQAVPAQQGQPHYLLAAAIGVVTAFVIGAGAFIAWNMTRASSTQDSAPAAPAAPAANDSSRAPIVVTIPPAPMITGAIPPGPRPEPSAAPASEPAASVAPPSAASDTNKTPSAPATGDQPAATEPGTAGASSSGSSPSSASSPAGDTDPKKHHRHAGPAVAPPPTAAPPAIPANPY